MTSLFDKLNLKPGERRAVMIVALVVFVVLNIWFVWPRLFELGRLRNRERSAQTTLQQFQREVDRMPQYNRRLAELEKQGVSVATEDQASKLQTTVFSQGALSGVDVKNYSPQPKGSSGGKTNQFFDETSATIQFISEERNLVDFLYNLGAGGSMIRVRNMSLSHDPPRQRLQGSLTLVASFARRAPARVGAPGSAAPAAAGATSAPRTNAPGTTPRTIDTAMRGTTNAPAQKTSWISRLWPFGKKTPAAPASTNAPARTNAPVRTNAPARK
jgi:Tfp pilus assembly protein PilO